MSRSYIATLALVAIIVLAAGALLRRRALGSDGPVRAPPSEAAALQQLSQEAQLRRMSEFLSDRIDAVAPFVIYLDTVGAAGVRWRGDDMVVSTTMTHPVLALRWLRSDTIRTPEVGDADSVRHDWMLIVARRANGSAVSTTTLSGGRSAVRCGEHALTEYVIGFGLHPDFAGGGLFGLDGQLLGIVARCGDRLAALPASEVKRLLSERRPVDPVHDVYGLELVALDARARAYFGGDSGLVVVSVRRASPAGVADVRPGDVILAIGGVSVASGVRADLLQTAAASDSLTIVRRRGRAVTTISLAAPAVATATARTATFGIDVSGGTTRGIPISSVHAGSAAAAAGLRAGDRLIRVGNSPVTSGPAAQRLLAATSGKPTFIVFERESVVRGVLIPQ